MKHTMLGVAPILVATSVAAVAQTPFADSFLFLRAVRERDSVTVSRLLSVPGSMVINTRDRSTGEGALHLLVRARDLRWLDYMLAHGARPDLQRNRGETPLTLAVQIGWLEGADQLLSRGASVNLANGRGETPLILAVQRREVPLVRLLLARRADPLKADLVAHMSALDYAKQDPRAAGIVPLLQRPR
jgi:ankyrin repeat protein